jgi:hypothetical protein
LAEIQEGVRRLQAVPLPSVGTATQQRIDELAALIRAADDLLAQYPPEVAGEQPEVSISRALTRLVRGIAFGFMREVNPDQSWFWTEEWQAGEREVDANRVAGRSTFFASDEDFDAHLRALHPDLAAVQ